MFNLLSGEFYKWKKSKSFKVCCFLSILFIAFLYGSFWMADQIQKGQMEQGEAGIVIETESESVLESLSLFDVEQVVYGTAASLITTVFVCIFVIGEYGNGAIKNMVGKGSSRNSIFLAKYVMAMIAAMVLLLISGLVTFIGGLFLFGVDRINAELIKNLCQYVGIQTLLGVTFAGIIVAIGEMSRNLGVGISVSIGVLMLAGILFNGLDLLFYKVDFRPSNYWIANLVSECPFNHFSGDFITRVLLACIFWIVVSLAAGMLHFKKADVK